MRTKAVQEKKEAVQAVKALSSIEAKARKAFMEDQAAAEAAEQQKAWVKISVGSY